MKNVLEPPPFKVTFSLGPLIDFWNNKMAAAGPYRAADAASIREGIAGTPELHGPIEDLAALESHGELVEKLFSVIFPAAFWETEVVGAVMPFTMEPAYVSPRFKKLFVDGTGGLRGRFHVGWTDFGRTLLISSYLSILRQCHEWKWIWNYRSYE